MSQNLIWQTISTGPADTDKLGELLGKQLKGGELIELRADLGGGKTTLVKGLVRGAGSQNQVTSPTFSLSRIYQTKQFQIHHFDFYRLSDPGILLQQLAESISQEKTVVIIEWADIVDEVLPEDRISIEFKPVANNPDGRQVTIKYPLSQQQLISKVEARWQESQP